MSGLESFGTAPVARAIGLALLHFVWQGFVLGALLAGTLASLRSRAAELRYTVCLGGMLALLAAPAATTWLILQRFSNPLAGPSIHLPLLDVGTRALDRASPLLPWLTGLWLLGASSLQVRMVVSWLRAERIKRVGVLPVPAAWHAELERLQRRLGVSRAVRVLRSSLVAVPSIVGWLRPVILIPADVAIRLTPRQLRAILAHELAHVRRHDYLVNAVQCVFESILFFHPVTWWVSGRLRAEREFCCDDIALSVCGSPREYAEALSSLEELHDREARPALASTGGDLMRRIARIFEERGASPAIRGAWLPTVAVVAGLSFAVALFGNGCLDVSGTDAVASDTVTGPAPDQAGAAGREATVAFAVQRIEAARDAGRIAPEFAERILAKVRSGDVVVADASACCPDAPEGAVALVCCPAGDGAGTGEGCCPEGAQAGWVGCGAGVAAGGSGSMAAWRGSVEDCPPSMTDCARTMAEKAGIPVPEGAIAKVVVLKEDAAGS